MGIPGRALVPLAGLAVTLAGLTACTALSFDGRWVGVCDTPDLGMRVDANVHQSQTDDDEDVTWVTASVHRPDRRGSVLLLTCDHVEEDLEEILVSDCRGSWEGTEDPHDLSLSGTMERGDLTTVLDGGCTLDGLSGSLDLWKLP